MSVKSETVTKRTFSFSRRKMEHAFNQVVLDVESIKTLIRKKGIPEDVLQITIFRSKIWKVFFGFLPENTALWIDKERMYTLQYSQFLNDFYYNINFPKTETLIVLQKDISRIFPDSTFFKDEENLESVQRILFVNCIFNKSIKYVQGMHEMCGLIFYVFSQSGQSREVVEAEAYFGFTTLVVRFRDWFDKACDNKPTGLKECFKNIDSVLKMYDFELWKYLNKLNVDVTCYSFRWVSMLFIDDFSIKDVIKIWDVLLSGFDSQQIFIDIICITISIIELHREFLLKSDSNTCLHHLMNIKNTADSVLERACKVRKFVESKHVFH
ncbi:tbc domain containing protein [Entamoeba histolytica]|nr:tbc domain containing protein [Entamoeba histolytica]